MINCFKKVGIYDLIDSFTFSYYLKVGKPKEEIFKIALDKMNISPKEAIMVGDNLTSDIESTRKLGLTTIWFNKDKKTNNTNIKPDFEICKIEELINYI